METIVIDISYATQTTDLIRIDDHVSYEPLYKHTRSLPSLKPAISYLFVITFVCNIDLTTETSSAN